MAKQAVAVRLTPEVIKWADGYAESRRVSRQVVLESAITSFMESCRGGVPDLPAAVAAVPGLRTARQVAVEQQSAPPTDYAALMRARQRRLNGEK